MCFITNFASLDIKYSLMRETPLDLVKLLFAGRQHQQLRISPDVLGTIGVRGMSWVDIKFAYH